MELKGKLIRDYGEQQISEKFKKREFAIEIENEKNSDWNDKLKFQIIQDKCNLLDGFKIGDVLNITFNIKGREVDGKFFNTLEAWKISR